MSNGQPRSIQILLVEDSPTDAKLTLKALALAKVANLVTHVEDGVQALEELQKRSYNLIISDLKMPKMNGLDLIEKITELGIPVLTVIMTGFGTVETAIEAMKHGAYDYILKPFKVEEVIHIVQRGIEKLTETRLCVIDLPSHEDTSTHIVISLVI